MVSDTKAEIAVEGERVPALLEAAQQGLRVLVVSDAGMPLVSGQK